MRDLFYPGRSVIHATNGMAATSHPLSTATAVNILNDGGNAIDAAIAAVAVQCVVEPHSTGIGGDCFCLLSKSSGEVIGYNGSGTTPSSAHQEWYNENNISFIEQSSPHSVTIPGAIDAWHKLCEKYDVHILSTAPWDNPTAWQDKRLWVADYLGRSAWKRLTLSHNKNLLIGDYLIDDRTANGAGDFNGEHIHFGTEKFPGWEAVLEYLEA